MFEKYQLTLGNSRGKKKKIRPDSPHRDNIPRRYCSSSSTQESLYDKFWQGFEPNLLLPPS
jgi:hypothetical protein